MKKAIAPGILLMIFVMSNGQVRAQSTKIDSLFARGDTTAIMDSLMAGFDAFLDSITKPTSFFSISAGVGNQTFSVKNNSLNTQEASTNQLSFVPAVGYYHKSGLGISLTGFMTSIEHSLRLYQFAITPSYDYISPKISAGISYSRYLAKDSSTYDSSPYDNDIYGYFYIRRKSWRFGISGGYAEGNFSDELKYSDSVYRYSTVLQRYHWVYVTKTIASNNHISNFSLSASLRKDFKWFGLLSKSDLLSLGITGYLTAGSSILQTHTNINYALKKISLTRLRQTYSSEGRDGFQIQSTALSISLYYSIGKFAMLPGWFIDYYLQDTETRLSQTFSFTVAFSF